MKYYHFEGSLVQPTMEEPNCYDGKTGEKCHECNKWRDHLRSLPKIKVEGKLKEGWVKYLVDFIWKPRPESIFESEQEYLEAVAESQRELTEYCKQIAVPVSETEAQGESDLPKIYIASKTKHAQRWIEWRESGVNIISTWIDEAGEGASPDLADLCKRCINECLECDAMIIYREGEDYLKGAFIEMGVALTRKIPIILVGDILPESSVFTQNGNVFTAETVEETIDDIKRNHHPNSQEERKHTDKEERAKEVEDKTLFIGEDWKKKYEGWFFNKGNAYFPAPTDQTKWIEDNILNPMKSQISGYRVLTSELIKRRDELINQVAASKDYAKGLLEWASGKFVQYVPGIWTDTYNKTEYTTSQLIDLYDEYLKHLNQHQ
jgi:hypothetical protein